MTFGLFVNIEFWLHFGWILSEFWLNFDWILAAFWLHFDCILTAFWLHFDCILTAFSAHLRNEDGNISLNDGIRVNDGLMQIFVENLPSQWKSTQVFIFQLNQRRSQMNAGIAQPFITIQKSYNRKKVKTPICLKSYLSATV